MNHYPVGSLVTVTGTFTDEATGEPVSPDTVTVQAWVNGGSAPSAAVSVITDVSTGVFSAELSTTGLAGNWTYRFFGSGGVQAAGIGQFTVDGIPV
jgi:hypothetical protein